MPFPLSSTRTHAAGGRASRSRARPRELSRVACGREGEQGPCCPGGAPDQPVSNWSQSEPIRPPPREECAGRRIAVGTHPSFDVQTSAAGRPTATSLPFLSRVTDTRRPALSTSCWLSGTTKWLLSRRGVATVRSALGENNPFPQSDRGGEVRRIPWQGGFRRAGLFSRGSQLVPSAQVDCAGCRNVVHEGPKSLCVQSCLSLNGQDRTEA